jgi:hypothetical protein
VGKCTFLKHPYCPVLIYILNSGEKETCHIFLLDVHNYIISMGYIVSNSRKMKWDVWYVEGSSNNIF